MRVSMRARRSGRKEKKNERMTEGGGVCACALTQKEKQPLKEKKKNMNEKKNPYVNEQINGRLLR